MLHHHRPERGAPLAYTVTDADGVPLIDEATIVSDPRDWVRFLTPWFAATLHTLSFDLPDGSLLCVPLQWEPALPPGLYHRNGRLEFECRVCGGWAEWPAEADEYVHGDPHNVCGRSPRCCP